MPLIEYIVGTSKEGFFTRIVKKVWAALQVFPLLARFLYLNRASIVRPRIVAFLRGVRSSPLPESGSGALPPKVGVAGFCWGGLYSTTLLHDAPDTKTTVAGQEVPLVDCGFAAHPSRLSMPGDIEAVVLPLSVANGENDAQMGEKGMVTLRAILEEKNEKAGREVHEAVVYPGAKHGFAVRGDRDDPLQKERGDKSEEQAVVWFRRHFEGSQ